MELVLWYAIACAIAGVMPCSFPLLMALEIGMVYHLSVKYRIPFRLGELSLLWGILVFCSLFLKLLAEILLTWFVGVGWLVKGGIAFTFVIAVGWLVDSYYAMERRKLDG